MNQDAMADFIAEWFTPQAIEAALETAKNHVFDPDGVFAIAVLTTALERK